MAQRKNTTLRSADRKRKASWPRLGKRAAEAVEVLKKWAADHTIVEFVDGGSIRHIGRLLNTSDAPLDSLEFVGTGGTRASILPFAWSNRNTKIQNLSEVHQSIFFEQKHGRKTFAIHKRMQPSAARERLAAAVNAVREWHESGKDVYVSFNHSFYGFAFLGKIVSLSDAGFLIEGHKEGGLLTVAFGDSAHAFVQNDHERVVWFRDQIFGSMLHISDVKPKPDSMFESLLMGSEMIH